MTGISSDVQHEAELLDEIKMIMYQLLKDAELRTGFILAPHINARSTLLEFRAESRRFQQAESERLQQQLQRLQQ
jgi:hypothetical protein